MTVIDVHTHMLSEPWLKLLKEYGPPRYEVRPSKDAAYGIHLDGAPFMTPQPGHWVISFCITLVSVMSAKHSGHCAVPVAVSIGMCVVPVGPLAC